MKTLWFQFIPFRNIIWSREKYKFILKSIYNMYIIKCKTHHQSRLDAWDKCSRLVHCDDPEGWDGEGGGRGVQDGEHM